MGLREKLINTCSEILDTAFKGIARRGGISWWRGDSVEWSIW